MLYGKPLCKYGNFEKCTVQLRNKCLVIFWGKSEKIGLWVLSEMMLDSAKENESLAKSDLTFSRNGWGHILVLWKRRIDISFIYLYMLLKAGISKKWISRAILFRQYNGHDLEKAEPLKFCILICGRHLTILLTRFTLTRFTHLFITTIPTLHHSREQIWGHQISVEIC